MHRFIRMKLLVLAIMFSNIMVANVDTFLSSYVFQDIASQNDSVHRSILTNSLNKYKNQLSNKSADSLEAFKNLGLIYAELNNPKESFKFTKKYIENSADVFVLNKESYNKIHDTKEYDILKKRYLVKFNVVNFIYFYIVLIGIFFAVLINFKKDFDKLSNLLLGGFILVNVMFILEFRLYSSNLIYLYPHTFSMSASISLLYGPLLYFYFKRITKQYVFKPKDALHLIPTLVMLGVLLPFYSLSGSEKLNIIFDISNVYSKKYFFNLIFIPKLTSYIIYGYFIGKLYFNDSVKQFRIDNPNIFKWLKNIFYLYSSYVCIYMIYGATFGYIYENNFEIINHLQVLAKSLMVIYIVQAAFLNSSVFKQQPVKLHKINLSKYLNSSLTESLSEELKQELIRLFKVDKVYRDCNLNLETLSKKLNTTRHNTSQIINEHFGMNFFELVNKFRIKEAIKLLENADVEHVNIIDIAYEVGFNNKVTFNKAFKKSTSLTPTQFIEHIKNEELVSV